VAASDLDALLKSLAKPATVEEMVARGDLIDSTTFASWVGFTVPAYMTDSVYDAVIGSRARKRLLNSEHHARGMRMRALWHAIQAETIRRRRSNNGAESIRLDVPAADRLGRVMLDVRTGMDNQTMYLIVRLTGE